MKKAVALALLTVMAVVWVPAFAKSVPSKTTQAMAGVAAISADGGAALKEDFGIRLPEETEQANKALEQLSKFVNEQGLAPARFFAEQVQQDIASLLPDDANLDEFGIQEMAPMVLEGYEEAYGDVTATFQFATQYADGQQLVALVGLVTGQDAQGNPVIEWIAVKAEAEGGAVKVHFPQDLLARLNGQDAMIAILSDGSAA